MGITEAIARQILVRAGRHLGSDRAQTVQPAAERRVVVAFLLASECGEVRTFEDVLAGDIVRAAYVALATVA